MAKLIINCSLLFLSLLITSCNKQKRADNLAESTTQKTEANSNTFEANKVTEIDPNICSIFQDSKGNYWFGTNGSGVYCYDGKTIIQFTDKDGLFNNQVQHIQEDKFGNLWFGTGLFGVSKFDGQIFTTFTNENNLGLDNTNENKWKIEANDLWFYAGGGVYHYGSTSFAYLPLAQNIADSKNSQNNPYNLSPYAVYSILKDKKGNLWFGTQSQGVCRYDGKSFTWFTEKGLAGPAVLGIFEDSKGNIWFGNNGGGLFKYDGKELTNFTTEKGLGNAEFKASGKSNPNSLARVYSINEDNNGNLWIGTVDAGVWQYDGNKLTNYNTKDGLSSNAVNIIYKDRKGELWFGTDQNGIYKFNGKSFEKFIP
ncbi:ligand-binding sensor domain-containing protein [Flavobacterium terrisoli]|uniref:ligand-binding sensor domain-containing protein n=1 Tax=Flavobacterium terrisoli TaxID=3242195 RepID=UPI002542883A|nr:two-component regulator propeller domain-containing protein [Flavobacterium buctense]